MAFLYNFLADLHTHTTFSHGKGSIEDNYRAGAGNGLKQVGISDHGLRHIAMKVKQYEIPVMRAEAERLTGTLNGCELLLGIEANIYGKNGEVDLTYAQRDMFDYVIAGFHPACIPKNILQAFTFNLSGSLRSIFPDVRVKEKYTRAYVKAIMSGKVDIISHLNLYVRTDVSEVGKAARDYGVMIELNGKGVAMTDDEVDKLYKLGVMFIVNSDAHTPQRVGDFSAPLKVIERVGIPEHAIANADKIIRFRR